ncbi:hypothetical protein JNW88_30815 [Micromonospora sp. ATA32]|nr:hypothetical protein [Micromonospora sp. ATA32]
MRFLYWLDRNMWAVPVMAFLATELGLVAWDFATKSPILLSSAKPEVRQQVYSSLSSTASSLLGFSIASVAILAAFAPRPKPGEQYEDPSEKKFARARGYVTISLLATSLFLLILLIAVSFALSLEPKDSGSATLTYIVLGSASASLVGLIAGGLGLSLAVVERTHNN